MFNFTDVFSLTALLLRKRMLVVYQNIGFAVFLFGIACAAYVGVAKAVTMAIAYAA